MLRRLRQLPVLVTAFLLVLGAASLTAAQTSAVELRQLLHEKSAFADTEIAALERGETVVRPAAAQNKREIAVAGAVNLLASAGEFLNSYRDSLTRRGNAVMQAGAFGAEPVSTDLEALTLEAEDIEDLKECVAGSCEIKLSAQMIQRFAREVDWRAPDYPQQATRLFKSMLLDYVKDYRRRGDAALIAYHDKQTEVRLGDELQTLAHAPGYLSEAAAALPQTSEMSLIEELLVWSKIKFGLKPVLAINHVTIYKSNRERGPQILAVSRQIYANHYFNSSLGLTAFVTVEGPESYLVYENRSHADGLEGPLGKLKRGIVQNKALEGLKGVLEQSKIRLETPAPGSEPTVASASVPEGWGRRLFGGVRPLLWVLIISALIALLALRNLEGKTSRAGVKQLKPEQR